jgi:hypothetical protein
MSDQRENSAFLWRTHVISYFLERQQSPVMMGFKGHHPRLLRCHFMHVKPQNLAMQAAQDSHEIP